MRTLKQWIKNKESRDEYIFIDNTNWWKTFRSGLPLSFMGMKNGCWPILRAIRNASKFHKNRCWRCGGVGKKHRDTGLLYIRWIFTSFGNQSFNTRHGPFARPKIFMMLVHLIFLAIKFIWRAFYPSYKLCQIS